MRSTDTRRVTLLTRTDGGAPQVDAEIPLSGDFFERYQMLETLGVGAAGMVMEAKDRMDSGRPVAIKFLRRVDHPASRERFLREGRALQTLRHPSIIRVYGLGEMEGHPYLVLELLTGGTLRDRIAGGKRLSLAEAAPIAADLSSALDACHAAGIVHRDVKPENVLFGADGRARLADLGLARHAGATLITATGCMLGTPLYMAPEQVLGGEAGPAADVYALALIVYEMLAGAHPFAALQLAAVLDHHLRTMPRPIHEQAPGTPEALWPVLEHALAKQVGDRIPSAGELGRRIAEVARASTAKPSGRRPALSGSTPALRRPAPPHAPPDLPKAVREPAAARLAAGLATFIALAFASIVLLRVGLPGGPVPRPSPGGASPASAPSRLASALPTRSDSPADAGAGGSIGGAARTDEASDPDDLVVIPEGELRMGTRDGLGDAAEHTVRLDRFEIDRREVTNARFARFVRATGYVTETERRGAGQVFDGTRWVQQKGASWRHPRGPEDSVDGKDELPVVQVTWADAAAFAAWAHKRLPTEAEWERAARGLAQGHDHPWGDDPADGRAACGRTPAEGPLPAGSFTPNDFQLHDVLGNVREWCADYYDAGTYRSSPGSNPTGPKSGRTRVVRGGSFLTPCKELSVWVRAQALPSLSAADLGFRTAP